MRTGELSAIIDLNEEDQALQPLTIGRPIGTLPFAGRYRLLDFPLSAITAADVHSVALFLPRSGRSVQDHMRSGAPWNLDLLQGGIFMFPYVATRDYSDEALRARYYEDYTQFLRKSGSVYTAVVGAKNVANVDLNAVLAYHKAGNNPITAVYKQLPEAEIDPEDWTLTLSEGGTATGVLKAKDRRNNGADTVAGFMDIYMVATSDLIDMLDTAAASGRFKRLPQLLREAVLANNANAFEYTGYLARITDLNRFYQTNMDMLDEKNYQSLLQSSVPILTKSKNEVPTFYSKDSVVSNSLVGTGAYIEGTAVDSVVFRNVVIHRDAVVESSVVMQDSKISTGATVRYAILDKGVVIGPNLTIEGTAENPVVIGKNQKVFQSTSQTEASHD